MNNIEKALEKVRRYEKELKKKQSSTTNSTLLNHSNKSVFQEKKNNVKNVKLVENAKSKTNTEKVCPINRKRLSNLGYLCSKNGNSQLSEEYRMIKRPLINNILNAQQNKISRANLILVASSQPGEGKTFTAINLALSIAREQGKKVLLIDADVAKPSISKVLGINNKNLGLIDFLDSEEIDFSQIILKTDIAGLSIVPAGSSHSYSTELLASKRMSELTKELHARYADRIVIFDSPPLLATTQAEVLAGLVGQVVFVVEAEKTIQSMVSDSIDKLKACDVVFGILNKATHTAGLNYYDYGNYGH